MSADFGLVYPLWNHAGNRTDLLDRVVGEVGINHLTLPVITGERSAFRWQPAEGPHHFHTEGGWHYPPDSAAYRHCSVRPRPAKWVKSRNVPARLAEYASAQKLALVFRVDLRAVRSLPEHAPYLRMRNAWGDEVTASGACVSNADLRELLRATLAELSAYEPAGFELVDWVNDRWPAASGDQPYGWHARVRGLLDTCFCPACRQIAALAGVDAEQAARSVRVHVERLASRPLKGDAPQALDDPVLEAYNSARRTATRTWLERLGERYPERRRFLVRDVTAAADAETAGWSALVRIGPETTWLLLNENLGNLGAMLGRRGGLALPVWRPAFDEAAQLVRFVSEASAGNVGFFDFEGLDQAPAEAGDWLRQAVRYARRG